jgi:hypothetical protein
MKGRHFDTNEAELQMLLNTLTEQDLQDALKKGRSTGNGSYMQKWNTWRVMEANRPKVRFWPDGSTSPGNYGYG